VVYRGTIMRKKRIVQILATVVMSEIIIISAICNRDSQAEPISNVTIRDIGPQAVLYTVHRGHYETVSSTMNKLHKLADSKGMCVTGPVFTGYLNDPRIQLPEHWLIEVRIPVSPDAMKFAGTLGKMTDVKILPAMKVAAAVKPPGQDNPETTICSLYSWIKKHGYRIAGGLWQSAPCDKANDYAQMRTEFMIPIESPTAIQG
jgi:effector-binding domain-containing protein